VRPASNAPPCSFSELVLLRVGVQDTKVQPTRDRFSDFSVSSPPLRFTTSSRNFFAALNLWNGNSFHAFAEVLLFAAISSSFSRSKGLLPPIPIVVEELR